MFRRGTRVLVVEDDPAIARLLQLELVDRGAEVHLEHVGSEAIAAVDTFRPDVVLLDILLPGMDGERILARLRQVGASTPVIMVTARDQPRDRIRNLNTGADDYLTKPFDIEELVARIGAVLRRVQPASTFSVGPLLLEPAAHRAWIAGEQLALTAKEYELLLVLARNAGQVLSRARLLDLVWSDAEVDPNIVDVYLGYLRRKFGAHASAPRIETVRGVGFRLVAE